jgi:hypothetical protein
MSDSAKGNEVLREIGGKIGRYLSELYHRVEELEAASSAKASPQESFEEPREEEDE